MGVGDYMGELTDRVRRMIESLQISSASPGHINEVLQIDPGIDLDDIIVGKTESDEDLAEDILGFEEKGKKKKADKTKFDELDKLTTGEISNLSSFARNPTGFGSSKILGKVGKFAIPVAIASAIFALVAEIIDILMRPGGPLDRRLRIIIDNQVVRFLSRQDKADLNIGLKNIRITTRPRLRGGQGKTSGNFEDLRAGNDMQIDQNFEARGRFTV